MLFSTIDDLTTDRRTQVEPSTKKSSTDHLTNKQTRISVSTIASFGAAAQKRTQPHTKKKDTPKKSTGNATGLPSTTNGISRK